MAKQKSSNQKPTKLKVTLWAVYPLWEATRIGVPCYFNTKDEAKEYINSCIGTDGLLLEKREIVGELYDRDKRPVKA